ncbi:MAG: hypothetical protein AUJ85_02080 [Elusimicrobia bacterium CG1_02_37_114]|nr:MAG: hypothetical protein AUJ85_02080 [Elusimicrobia bacterium CG1_02_37_114]PIV53067.1 MAG: hypothetical protein COS17_05955 [Elusimicrobia bacterium CG02_land_8_20_14_3_00_37_13]
MLRATLEKVIKQFLPIFYFVVSIMFYLRTYDSCQIKITIVHIGGVAIFALLFLKLLEEKSLKFYRDNFVIVLPVLLVLLSNIVSHFFCSPLKYASGMELIRKMVYFSITLLVIKEINTQEKFERFIRWLFFAALIVTFYGLIQALDGKFFRSAPLGQGLDPFIWRLAFGNRIFSTFGNPNFYGDFLVVIAPIILAMFLRTKKVYLLILYFLTAVNVYLTYSKGAYIGFVAGFIVFWIFAVLFLPYFKKGDAKKIVTAVVIAMFIVCAVVVGYMSKKRTDSIKFRIYTWVSCWEMINTRPILGTGVGTFYVTYPSWRRPQIFCIEGRHNTESDHPENEYLEVWYDEGTIGFGIFLWLVFMVILVGYRGMRTFSGNYGSPLPAVQNVPTEKKPRKSEDVRTYYMLGILSAFIATLVHNFVCVSLRFVSSGVFMWLLVGLIGALVVHNPLPVRISSDDKSSRLARLGVCIFWLICFYWWEMPSGIVIPICVCLFIISEILEYKLVPEGGYTVQDAAPAKPGFLIHTGQVIIIVIAIVLMNKFRGFFIADAHHNISIFHSKRGEWVQALQNYDIVVKNNPGFIMAHYFMGNVFNDRWSQNREFHPEWHDKEPSIDPERAIRKYEDVWSLAPNYVQTHHQAGLVFLKWGEMERAKGDMEKSRELWMKAIEQFEKYHAIDPIFAPNYHRMAWVYVQLGDMKKAEETYFRHIYTSDKLIHNDGSERTFLSQQLGREVGPQFCADIHDGHYHSLAWEDWGGRRKEEYAETYVNLGNLRFLTNDFSGAEKYYSKALEMVPDYINALKNLAIVFGKVGREAESVSVWNRLRLLNPQDPDVQRVFNRQK